VRKTVIPRPVSKEEKHVPGQQGVVRAAAATMYGSNWYHNTAQDLIEIWDAGPALCFQDVLPKKDLYAREGLYLRLTLAYRTSANACANIRTFSGNHVTLLNAPQGAMYEDPYTRYHVTDDLTLNINSINRNERLWLQRVEWEWVSQETIYEDEVASREPYLERTPEEVEAQYVKKDLDEETVRQVLIENIRTNDAFAKRALLLLYQDSLQVMDLPSLYRMLNHGAE
jgi:hypothetical protein